MNASDNRIAVPADPRVLAAHLRRAVGDLVRATRGADVLAPITAAVMDLLDRGGPMTTAELASRRQVRHQTMATTVKDLHDAGYVVATSDEGDGRKKILSLTGAGRQALERDRQDRVTRLAAAMERSLTDDELRAVADALPLIDRVTASIMKDRDPALPARSPVTGDW